MLPNTLEPENVMLEKVPAPVGHALEGVRAGADKLIWADKKTEAPDTITLTSEAFDDGGFIPPRFTADGEGTSPPFAWSGAPPASAALILVVEDADSPTPQPFVHALALLPTAGASGRIDEGRLVEQTAPAGLVLGHNTFRKAGWLPPDPPTGHGPHRYVFQIYALGERPDLPQTPEKHDIEVALNGRVLARGRLTGLYERPGKDAAR